MYGRIVAKKNNDFEPPSLPPARRDNPAVVPLRAHVPPACWPCVIATVIVIIIMGALGCNIGPQPSPSEPVAEVRVHPIDVTTAWDDAPLRVTITRSGLAVSPAFVDALAEGIVLATWPQRDPIPAEIEISERGEEGGEFDIEARPRTTLSDQWYVLTIPELDDQPTDWTISGAVPDPDGGYHVRFRPDSHPILHSIRVCEKRDGPHRLAVFFSEPVDLQAGATMAGLMQIYDERGETIDCRFSAPDSQAELEITANCTTWPLVPSVRVQWSDGLEGTRGNPIATGEGWVHQLDLVSEACTHYGADLDPEPVASPKPNRPRDPVHTQENIRHLDLGG